MREVRIFPRPAGARTLGGGLIAIALGLLVAGCSGAERSIDGGGAASIPRSGSRGPVSAIESRVDHVMGTTLFMPVTIEGKADAFRVGPIGAVLEDGRDVGARLVWVTARPDPTEHARWLAPAGMWAVADEPGEGEPGAIPADGQGFWAVVSRLPVDGAGQGLWVAGSLIELNWVVGGARAEAGKGLEAIAPVYPGASGSPGFDALVRPERDSPGRRWRAMLATEGLRAPDPIASLDPLDDAGGSAVEALEAMAEQQGARWATGLMRLWSDDPDVCERLRRALCAVASFESGVMAPVWRDEPRETESLLRALLDPKGTSATRVRAATLYMSDQPAGACWVIDDAGRVDAVTGRALSTMGLANLSERSTLAWAAPSSSDVSPALEPLGSRRSMVMTTASSPTSVEGVGRINAHVGRWESARTVIASPLRAVPPGLRMGPLLPGLTLSDWLRGGEPAPGRSEAAWTTAALLERMPGASGAWTAYFECRRPRGIANDADSVRLWLGPFGRPASVVRVTRDGSVRDEIRSESGASLVGEVRVTDDRWSFRVRLPAGVVQEDGVLMIGIERISTGGRRWSWPRPMTPWQVEPGRVRVDLNAWEGTGG